MLPFIKERHDSPVPETEESGTVSFSMLDAVAEDMITAIRRGDKGALKEVLQALIEHMESRDEMQDSLEQHMGITQ